MSKAPKPPDPKRPPKTPVSKPSPKPITGKELDEEFDRWRPQQGKGR